LKGWPAVALAIVALALGGLRPAPDEKTPTGDSGERLVGKLLIAAPSMPDPRFKETVILMVEHDKKGAMGLVVNRVLGTVELAKFFHNLGIETKDINGMVRVHYGGPVQPEFGFVIHSTDYISDDTKRVTETIAVSPETTVLAAFARGEGPKRTLFAVGYAGWGPGQLESEMERNDWFTAPLDLDIVFDENQETKWKRAMALRYRTL
jgi:putative transcriptional regulator